MSRYLVVETRSRWESSEVGGLLDLVRGLSEASRVDLFLIQNAVLMARAGAEPGLDALVDEPNVQVWADDFSLDCRGLGAESLNPGVRRAGADALVELLARPGCKPIWH